MSSLVTGAGGFVGQWLLRALLERGERVTGFTLAPAADIGVLTPDERRRIDWIDGDIRDSTALTAALEQSAATAVYHLAGITYVPAAGKDPLITYEVNTLGAARLLTAATRVRDSSGRDLRVLLVGSAAQYGRHDPANGPIVETASQRPLTVYAASKAAQEIIALQTYATSQLDVVLTRSFNHSGRGQESHFLLPALIRRIKSLGPNTAPRVPIGNIGVSRDFLHVSDVTHAYIALMERGQSGEVYNVSSGKGWTVQELTELALQTAGVSAEVFQDETLVRPVELEWLVGDNRKLRQTTGWTPKLRVHDILAELWQGSGL